MAERLCVRDDPTLGALVVLLAVVCGFAIWAGLMWAGDPPPVAQMTTPRGETVTLFGDGVYRFNDTFHALAFRAQDGVMALALLVALWAALAMRGGRALAMLMAALGFIAYGYGVLVFSAAIDWIFPVHVAAFGLALLTLWRAGGDVRRLMERPGLPRGLLAAFLVVAGLGTAAVWGPVLLAELTTAQAPHRLGGQTTPVTQAIDLGILVPLSLVSAVLVLRRRAPGHVVALPILGVLVFLLPSVIAATILQMQAGIEFDLVELVGPIGSVVILGLLAVIFLRGYLVALREEDGVMATPNPAPAPASEPEPA
ncbi:MAG: hypothetical protein ACXIUV_12325 [Alkalilacustris sp.]